MISISKIEYLLRPTSIYPLLRGSFRRAALRQWRRTARPPAPLEVKAQIIRHYAAKYGLRNFIETGTFFGDMLAALRNDFDALTTIELDFALAARATQRFAEEPKITVIQGDSARVLPALLCNTEATGAFLARWAFLRGSHRKRRNRYAYHRGIKPPLRRRPARPCGSD